MAFPNQFLDELRARIRVSEVVSPKVRLVQRGQEFTGLCPFHNEKTPSFTVNDSKGFYHCFGCGAHGDVISFLMQADGLSFLESVEKLAEIAADNHRLQIHNKIRDNFQLCYTPEFLIFTIICIDEMRG